MTINEELEHSRNNSEIKCPKDQTNDNHQGDGTCHIPTETSRTMENS